MPGATVERRMAGATDGKRAPERGGSAAQASKKGRPQRPLRRRAAPKDGKLGTFLGVFTPTVLTILGVIMYLRTGWVVAEVGLAKTILIVLLANAITLVTTLSFSAVATNTRVGVGGAYYIISRSLGLELGGAIGLPLFLSQVFSVTLYAFGLAESLRIVWEGIPVEAAAFLIVLGVGALAYKGADLALKTQIPLMVFIGVSLVALATGAILSGSPEAAEQTAAAQEVTTESGFWAVFAVFFPAVTGIMAGLGLSGDLRDPKRSIPRGALFAVLVGLIVYLVVPVLLVMGADHETLLHDPMVWTRIAPGGGWLVLPGLWGAIFSSAIGSMLGAPRTLQALAMDHVSPQLLERLTRGKVLEVGMVVSLAIALGGVLLGDLNAVAPVVSMFFLTVYATVNIVAALETLSGDTSWRPTIRVPWPVSLAGGLACLGVMFLINPLASVAAIAVELILFLFFARRETEAAWGDARRGVYEALVRWALIRLKRRPMTARNWRPHVLVFAEEVERRLDLVRFGNWFSQGRGVVTVCELIIGQLDDEAVDPLRRRVEAQKALDRANIVAFAEVDVAPSLEGGIAAVAQANGMGELMSNTILLGWPADDARLSRILSTLHTLEKIKKSVLIGRIHPRTLFPRALERREIHVWWGGLQQNGDLMLLLAHLLTRNPEWRGARVKVKSIASNEHARQQTQRYLKQLIPDIRIAAEPDVVVKPKETRIHDLIKEESSEADVVFLGLATPERGKEADYAARLALLAEGLPTVFFVRNASVFVGQLVETPDAPVGDRNPPEREG